MNLLFVSLRSIVVSTAFVWLCMWVAGMLRAYDNLLGGPLPAWTRSASYLGFALGGALAGWCIAMFIARGHGTPAPFDAPRHFVAAGPYRYVRNPMYIGGALLLLALGLYRQSPSIVVFIPVWLVLAHLLVIFYEEWVLRGKFANTYDEYQRRTPRWIPRLGAQ